MTKARKPLTVLQIIPQLNMGGVERGTIDVAKYLKDNGYGSIVISSGGKLVYTLLKEKIPHIILPVHSKNPFTLWLNSFRIRRVIKNYHVDIVHARSRAPAWSAWLATRKTKVVFLTTFHGTYNFSNKLKKFYNSIMTKGQKIIAPSTFIKNHIVTHYDGVTSKKITVIPRGVSLKTFNTLPLEAGRLKKLSEDYRLPLDKKIILLPGRITRWKGHLNLLKALTLLKNPQKFYCVFVGPSNKKNQGYYQEIESFIQSNKLELSVRILPATEDLVSLYKIAHVVVSASTDPEAFGRVMAEAGAVGRPIIASNHGGAQEIVLHDKTGWLYEPGNVEALAYYLEKALSLNIKEYKVMSKAAIEHIQQNFTNDLMLSRTLTLYKSLAGKTH
ncbi:MAG: glycosyltransferase family 4 protein [Alphaproteobacteria bacterium]|nr:glycosyltransferase family 4 protein [Alphaproteobacteria bacterium]